jgi:Flp pilus assembly protein TadB
VPIGTIIVIGQVAAGFGIANEKKWGYWLGVVLMALQVAFLVLYFSPYVIINLMIYGAMLALLLHRQSREYRRIWFR